MTSRSTRYGYRELQSLVLAMRHQVERNPSQIAEALGVAPSSVSTILRNLGFESWGRARGSGAKLRRLYGRGELLSMVLAMWHQVDERRPSYVAEVLGVSVGSVSRATATLGLRPLQKRQDAPADQIDERRAVLLACWEEGLTVAEMAQVVGVVPNRVSADLSVLGLSIRGWRLRRYGLCGVEGVGAV